MLINANTFLPRTFPSKTDGLLACRAACNSKPDVRFLEITNDSALALMDVSRQSDATALISLLFVRSTHPED
jgi:hypothetical protein